VHVAGDVARPGVVRVSAGARVVDAIEAAGGGLPDADLDRLNLAAKVADGQRVAVAKLGAPAPVETGAATGGGEGAGGGPTGPINLNTATATQLEELPGIGPSLAAAIITEREKRGGFKAVTDLQDVRDRRAPVRRHQDLVSSMRRFGPAGAGTLVAGILVGGREAGAATSAARRSRAPDRRSGGGGAAGS
jgi:comEA protein